MKMLMLSLMLVLSSVGAVAFADHDVVRSDSVSLNFKKTDYSFVISWVEGPKKGASRFIMKTWKKDLGTMNAVVLFGLLALLALGLWLTSQRPMRWMERRYWRRRNKHQY